MGMITFANVRYKDGEKYPIPPRQETIIDALGYLAEFDFGYGAHVSDMVVSDQEIMIETTVSFMGCVDVTRYSGAPEDMRLFVRLSELVTMMSDGERGKAVLESAARELADNHHVSPRLISLAAPMIVGGKRAHGSLVIMLALEHYEEHDPRLKKVIEIGREVSIKNLVAAHELSAEDADFDFTEVLEMALPIKEAA